MYAYDSKMSSTLASNDGEHWQAVEVADVPTAFDDVKVVKGTTSFDTTPVTQGDYEGESRGEGLRRDVRFVSSGRRGLELAAVRANGICGSAGRGWKIDESRRILCCLIKRRAKAKSSVIFKS